MSNHRFLIAIVVFLIVGTVSPPLVSAQGQLGVKPKMVPLSETSDEFALIQKTIDNQLVLTPNESFFPALGLRASGQGNVDDIDGLNKGSAFSEITGWNTGESAEWGLLFEKRGRIEIRVVSHGGGQFAISLDNQEPASIAGESYKLSIADEGFHTLRLHCRQSQQETSVGRLLVTGEAVIGAGVVRKRWRPAAAHTKFKSSNAPKSIRLWIMEMDAVPNTLGFYSPITTPFGYYGPSWNADGTVKKGFNFSLWSYGRNQPEPPINQLSHLIAVGHPDASFSGFGHEGTGVKIREWEPLAGRQGQRQAIALRVEPGDKYDTYHSYFFASDEKRWQLFGSGKKYNKGKPLESLWVGSFVEVPGPSHVQRTGVYTRRMLYRGWVMDEDKNWYRLDRMTNGNIDRETALTHTNRGVTDNGWFFLETGGWTFRKPPNNGREIAIAETAKSEAAEYLMPNRLKALMSVPSTITPTKIERGRNGVEVDFTVRNFGQNSAVAIYWGSDEGLTFADRWQHSASVPNVREGTNRYSLPGVAADKPVYVRLLLKNELGKFWSNETIRITR